MRAKPRIRRIGEIKQTIRAKPYLLDAAYKMSFAQAQVLTQNEGFLPFEETVAKAKAKSNLPEDAWAPVYRLLARNKRPGVRVRLYLRRHRAATIAAACVIAIILSFASPTVRAYAVELYQKAVRFVTGNMEIFTPRSTTEQQGDTMLDVPDGSIHVAPSVSLYTNLDVLMTEKGIAPSLTLVSPEFTLQEIALTEWAGLISRLRVSYSDPSGKLVVIDSNLEGEDTVYSLPDNADVWTMPLADGVEMICAVDPIDGSFSGNVAIDGVPVIVYAEEGIDIMSLKFCIEE